MKLEIYCCDKNKTYYAEGYYLDDGVTVKKNGKINKILSGMFKPAKRVVELRQDPSVVDSDGIVLKDCSFKSPSTAAQFITGRSTDGYDMWRLKKDNIKLGEYLLEKGLRVKQKRGKAKEE